MAGENNSANMSMPVPGVGITTGPTYATDLNNSLTILDGHDHSAGKGVQITPAGLSISSDLSFLSNNATALRSMRMTVQGSLFSLAADIGCLYVNGVDLYYRDISGNNVRITSAGAVAGTPGSISNLVAPASATYVPGTQTFVWQSAALTPANMDAASLLLRNLTASSHSLTLNPPAAMGSDSSITLPTLPGAAAFVTIDASGNMGSSTALTGALTTSNLSASAGILGTQLAAATITSTQIASSTITGTNVANSINLPGNTVQENGKNVVVANTNATASLAIIQGTVGAGGAILTGEGYTSANTSAGSYTLAWTSALSGTPIVIATTFQAPFVCFITSTSTAGAVLEIRNSTNNVLTNAQFNFIAIGQRA